MKAKRRRKTPDDRDRQRTEELASIQADGALAHDCRRFVMERQAAGEPPWKPGEGELELTEKEIAVYIDQADKLLASTGKARTETATRQRQLAMTRSLFAKSVASGDTRAALQCLKYEATLTGLAAPRKRERKPPAPRIETAADVAELLQATLANLLAGKIDVKAAAVVMNVAAMKLKALETVPAQVGMRDMEQVAAQIGAAEDLSEELGGQEVEEDYERPQTNADENPDCSGQPATPPVP